MSDLEQYAKEHQVPIMIKDTDFLISVYFFTITF